MRSNTVCRLSSLALAVSVAACSKPTAQDIVERDSTVAEGSAQGTLYWDVKSNGQTALVIKDSKGSVVKHGVTGQLSFEPLSGSDPEVSLEAKDDTGVWVADGPRLDDELTLVDYALIVDGRPWTGALHLPRTGTAGLRETARLSAGVDVRGTHGGTIQVIGKARYEVLADSASAQMRVYLVGDAAIRPKHVRLALEADKPELVELEWDPGGYYVADIHAERPRAVTLVVVDSDDHAHVALVGYRPGVVFVVDAAPVFWVRRDWGPPGLARGHYKGTPWGPPGQGGERFHGKEGHGGRMKMH